jgi:hypothetical protein
MCDVWTVECDSYQVYKGLQFFFLFKTGTVKVSTWTSSVKSCYVSFKNVQQQNNTFDYGGNIINDLNGTEQ